MNCEKCRWYKRTYPAYTFGEFSARCMLGGCDESRYDPKDGKDEGIESTIGQLNSDSAVNEAEEGE